MDFLLGVEIDNSRIAWILDSRKLSASTVRLTTVTDNQHKAILNFFIKYSGKKDSLFTETLTGLPLMNAGKPSIDIVPRISNKSLNYEIYVNGNLVRRSTHSLEKYMRNRKPFLIAAGVAGFIAAVVLLYFLLAPLIHTKPSPKAEKQYNKPAVEVKKDEMAAEKPSAEIPDVEVQGKEEHPPEEQQKKNGTVFIESEISDKHSVYFNPDSSELTVEAISSLRDFINGLPHRGDFAEGEFELEIRGHCARYGTEEGRAELSRERAVNVYDFLNSEWGIQADSFVTGVGAAEPLTLNRNEQYLNRRVDINIIGNVTREQNSE